jgi:hypothetical protein
MSGEAKTADITVQDTADHSEVRQTNASVYFRRKEQKCTDVACLVVFCVFWAGMLAIMGISIMQGNPRRLMYGTDYLGNTCGDGVSNPTDEKRWLSDTFKFTRDYEKPKDDKSTFWDYDSWNDFYKAHTQITYPRTNVDEVRKRALFVSWKPPPPPGPHPFTHPPTITTKPFSLLAAATAFLFLACVFPANISGFRVARPFSFLPPHMAILYSSAVQNIWRPPPRRMCMRKARNRGSNSIQSSIYRPTLQEGAPLPSSSLVHNFTSLTFHI